jgi:hypothetical protein
MVGTRVVGPLGLRIGDVLPRFDARQALAAVDLAGAALRPVRSMR